MPKKSKKDDNLTDKQRLSKIQKVNPVSMKADQKIRVPQNPLHQKKVTSETLKPPSEIKNPFVRREQVAKLRHLKAKEKRERREQRDRTAKELGDEAPPKQEPKSIDKMREHDETLVTVDDDETLTEEAIDEFSEYFSGKTPKILLTTSTGYVQRPVMKFISELLDVFHGSEYYPRTNTELKKIVEYANNRDFTDIIVLNVDKADNCNQLTFVHLPEGPTAIFKLNGIKLRKDIPNCGTPTDHQPEVILNNFNTRLGHTIGRMFCSLFPQDPEFIGRRVITFHNQRDFIFFRHHRYIINDDSKDPEKKNVRLQECGPRFCLKLRSVQKGTFDSKFGEFEFVFKPSMHVSRKKFYL